MQYEVRDLLGRGPSFPYNLSDTGGLEYTEDIERINQSLFLLFETDKGSRLMMPEFGSDLRKYKFEPLDNILMEKIRQTIKEDIRKWEPRLSVVSIEFLKDSYLIDSSILYISITYKIINTSIKANYVYPYNLNPEGTPQTYDTLEINYSKEG